MGREGMMYNLFILLLWTFVVFCFGVYWGRKCAKVADLADENKCEWIGGNILVHFGVEE